MKRVGVYFRVKPGKQGEYAQRHKNLWPEMRAVLDEAGFRNYSIWSLGDSLFAYYEVEDPQKMEKVLAASDVYAKWRDEMEEYIYIDDKGQKEWPMEMVFLYV